jgi:hypothetical protein
VRFVAVKPTLLHSGETPTFATITVYETEKDSPRIVLPDGTELIGVVEMGFHPE